MILIFKIQSLDQIRFSDHEFDTSNKTNQTIFKEFLFDTIRE